jgi:adenosylmethionine-8-amino-7-oxononanoate aminotransferase
VQFHHGHTYGGNPIACAAGLAVLNEFLGRDILSNVRLQGQRLRRAPGRVGGALRDYRRGARGGASSGVRIRE